jgi:iodotyrosine deiodinase
MSFKKLLFNRISQEEMARASSNFLSLMHYRRSVREFSDQDIPIEVIKNIVSAAAAAPSGANKEPWYFSIVSDPVVKHEIRIRAENEEKAFYTHKAPASWLEDLNKFGTDWHKEFLDVAPYLIIVFKQIYDLQNGEKYKNYYVNESVGIACGILLTAIHSAGLVALTHTPSPMGFLEKACKRPPNERAFLLIPVGYPDDNAKVPDLKKKQFSDYAEII